MKKMIHSLLSVFQRSLLSTIAIFLLILFSGFTIQKDEDQEASENIRFYSKANLLREFSKDSVYAVIIKNNKSCLNCFQIVYGSLEKIKDQFNLQLAASSYSDSTSLARKRNIYELSAMFPEIHDLTVSYSPAWNETTTTPELLIIKNKKIHRFTYEKLFANGFELIAPETRKQILTILNSE